MVGHHHHAPQPAAVPDEVADDFFDQIFSVSPAAYGAAGVAPRMGCGEASGGGGGGGGLPVASALEQGRPPLPARTAFHGHVTQGAVGAAPQPLGPQPRVRARRGQATDPHSIAERIRRERIAERMRALHELVPSTNKTDRAAMLDEVLDYVRFLRLQVKVLSMSRLGGASAVAQLVADIPVQSVEPLEVEGGEGGIKQHVWEKWSNDGMEQQVAKLMEKDVGAAMQLLQSKALCLMPISLANTIDHSHHQSEVPTVKPEPCAPS